MTGFLITLQNQSTHLVEYKHFPNLSKKKDDKYCHKNVKKMLLLCENLKKC